MKYTQIKIGFLSIALLLCSANIVAAVKQVTKSAKVTAVAPVAAPAAQDMGARSNSDDDNDHCSPVKIDNLCSNRIKTKSLVAKKICAHKVLSDHLTTENATVTEKLCANDLRAPVACIGDLTAQNFCSNGLAKFADLQQCGKFRATAVFDAIHTYTLGCNLNYNVIVDDPNNNYTAGNPDDCTIESYYTAPVSGYYIVTVQIDQTLLTPFDGLPILGTPIANLHIDVNGITIRQSYTPYLAFLNKQNVTITALVSLKTGDVISAHYNVLVLTETAGLVDLNGSVQIIGNGSEQSSTMFKIHYLSSDCLDLPCGSCDFTCTTTPEKPCPTIECNPCCHRD